MSIRNTPQEWLTIAEAAEIMRLSTDSVRYQIKVGHLPATRVGKLYRVRRGDVDRLMFSRVKNRNAFDPAGMEVVTVKGLGEGVVARGRPTVWGQVWFVRAHNGGLDRRPVPLGDIEPRK